MVFVNKLRESGEGLAVAMRRVRPRHCGGFVEAALPVALACLVLAGCRKEEAKPAVDPASPAAYMKDAAFRQDLKEARLARNRLEATRGKIVAQMTAKIEAAKACLGAGADEAALKRELEKDAEWKSLCARCEDLNVAIGEARQKGFKTVRERLSKSRGKNLK